MVVESHHAMWRLLLEVPSAAAALNQDAHLHGFRIDEGVAHLVTADNTEAVPVLGNNLAHGMCAHEARAWLEAHPAHSVPARRRKALFELVKLLTVEPKARGNDKNSNKNNDSKVIRGKAQPSQGARSDASQIPVILAPPLGPLGDLLSEVLEELISGSLDTSDAVNVDLIHILARLYVERCQYRRSQELFERANYLLSHGSAAVDLSASQPWAFLASSGALLDGVGRDNDHQEMGEDAASGHKGRQQEQVHGEELEGERKADTMLLTLEEGLPGGALAFMTTKTVSSTAEGTIFNGKRQRALFQSASPSPHRLPPSDADIEFVRKQARERSAALKHLQGKSRSMPTFDASGRARETALAAVPKVSTKLAATELHSQLT